jgi:hypothetical protein
VNPFQIVAINGQNTATALAPASFPSLARPRAAAVHGARTAGAIRGMSIAVRLLTPPRPDAPPR